MEGWVNCAWVWVLKQCAGRNLFPIGFGPALEVCFCAADPSVLYLEIRRNAPYCEYFFLYFSIKSHNSTFSFFWETLSPLGITMGVGKTPHRLSKLLVSCGVTPWHLTSPAFQKIGFYHRFVVYLDLFRTGRGKHREFPF